MTWKKLALVSLEIAIVCLVGCTNKPTNQQLAVWLEEARDRNAEIVAKNPTNNQQTDWNLIIQGQTATEKKETLNWSTLQELATVNINTVDANNVVNPNKVFTFTGISVKSLIKEFGISEDVKNITFVCYDAYQVTIKVEDLLKYPIILATSKNGKPIPRSEGGPIYLVFPYTQHPEIKEKYDDGMWAFYVTHLVFGTEKPQIRIGEKELKLADLDKLPQVTLNKNVKYRVRWPSEKVELHGARIKDILSLARVQLKSEDNIFVTGKPMIYQQMEQEQTIPAAIVQKCDVILATRWGNNKELISASMGGPITLAFGDNCNLETQQLKWLTFVEGLVIQP